MASTFEQACARTEERLEEVFKSRAGIPSVVVGLVKEDETRVLARGSAAPAQPVGAQTLYALASCLKPMTAMVLLDVLCAQGAALEGLRRPLGDLYPVVSPADVSVQHLLAHRGYPQTALPEPGGSLSLSGADCTALARTPLPPLPSAEQAGPLRFIAAPGYQNDNYWLAGWLLARRAPAPDGESGSWTRYERAMRERLWSRLDMPSTCCRPTMKQLSRGACPMQHVVLAGRTRLVPTSVVRFDGVSMGEAYSCAADLVAFLRVAANERHWAETGQAPENVRGLLDRFRAARQFPFAEADAAEGSDFGRRHGTGWTAHEDVARAGEIWHRGDKLGYQAVLAADPIRRTAVCVLSNVWAHTPEEAARAGLDPRTTLNRSARLLQRLAEHAMDLLRSTGAAPGRDGELQGWVDAPPLAITAAASQEEREFVFETDAPDTFARVKGDRVGRVVLPQGRAPGWESQLIGALNVQGGPEATLFRDARPRGFEPTGTPAAALAGTWRGSLVRPWWWSRLAVDLAPGGQGDSSARIAQQPALELRNVLVGSAPLRPYSSTAPLPLLHAEVLVPAGGGYGLIDLLRVEEGGDTALLGDWRQLGQRYHVALWRTPTNTSSWRWPALRIGRWGGLLLPRDGAPETFALEVLQRGVGRGRKAILNAPGVGEVRLRRLTCLNGALRLEALGPAGHRVYGWGAFFRDDALGTLVLPQGAYPFRMRRLGT